MASRADLVSHQAEVGQSASQLASRASVEMSGLDEKEFQAARVHLEPGQKIFVSHLPGQTWRRTFEVCQLLSGSGFHPVPHIPVRLLIDKRELDGVLDAAREAGALELLLISGDYAEARGSFNCVLDVLREGTLRSRGFERISLAGHPEGHPQAPWDVICQAQVDKWRTAAADGLQVNFVTQFCFDSAPLIQWARFMRAAGVEATLSVGLAGPTALGKLLKLARHCGVGASLRLLTARPASMLKLLADHRPDALIQELALEKLRQPDLFDGIHLFSLGGLLRTASWLRQFRSQRSV
jgi:methylenetetrahydrofolate reductase (NADPH)